MSERTVADDTCEHGTSEDELCSKCERNPECNWNDGGFAAYCCCDVGTRQPTKTSNPFGKLDKTRRRVSGEAQKGRQT